LAALDDLIQKGQRDAGGPVFRVPIEPGPELAEPADDGVDLEPRELGHLGDLRGVPHVG
jgi:hypothetical protein